MCGALKELGIKLDEDWSNSKLTVHGCAGRFPVEGAQLSLGNAGTAMRPLTAAVAAAGRGEFILDGVARMRERPIQDLVDGLVQLGACPTRHLIHLVLHEIAHRKRTSPSRTQLLVAGGICARVSAQLVAQAHKRRDEDTRLCAQVWTQSARREPGVHQCVCKPMA